MGYLQGLVTVLSVIGAAIADVSFPSHDVLTNQVAVSNSPYASAPLPAPVPTYNKWEHDADQTISLQSGYEGYLVPAEPTLSLGDVFRTAGLLSLIPPVGKLGLKFALRFGVWFLGFGALFLVGSLVTSTVCTFTPLCTISFLGLGPFSKDSVRSFISEDRLNSVTHFVMEAIKKYRNLNKKSDDKSR